MRKVFVFDPTVKDKQSKVRGLGRYLKVLKESFKDEFVFTDKLLNIPQESVLINPFLDFLKQPILTRKVAQKQIGVIHDLIRLKYPKHFPAGIKGKINIFLNKQTLKNYNLIVTDSNQSKKDIVQILGLKPEKIKVVYPALSKIFLVKNKEAFLSPKLQKADYCLYVGDVSWNKNILNLAKAIKKTKIKAVFVGQVFEKIAKGFGEKELKHQELSEFRSFIKEVKGNNQFVFTGFVSDQELINLYQQAKVNLLISRDEGFGYSYLEAGSQKTPSILSNIFVFKEIADKGAIFVDQDNPESIAQGIEKAFFDKKLRQKLGNEAKKRSVLFSQKKFKQNFLELLKVK